LKKQTRISCVEDLEDFSGEEKIIETKSFVVISYEDWEENELPNF